MHKKYPHHRQTTVWTRRFITLIISLMMIMATPGVLMAKGGRPPRDDKRVNVIIQHVRGSGNAAQS